MEMMRNRSGILLERLMFMVSWMEKVGVWGWMRGLLLLSSLGYFTRFQMTLRTLCSLPPSLFLFNKQ